MILFVDEVYIARSTSYFFELFDLEQASVLRGPQGALFGKNVWAEPSALLPGRRTWI